ncbi:MAG: energy transducer TonB [Gemmatimonadaceae bacterium]|nr:energy transducer TonB [Gemmatimonadaceae bacterium]
MLFRRLSQYTSGSLLTAVEGYVVSLVTHAIILGVFFAPRTVAVPDAEIPESFQWAKFLLPKDRAPRSSEVREHLTFMNTPAVGGRGTLLDDVKEPERLELELPPGGALDHLADIAAPPPPQSEVPGGEVLTVLDVDTAAVRVEDSAAPPYPSSMLEKRIEGSVAVQYIVDTTGHADTTSFTVLSTTHQDFAKSVRSSLPFMRFRPAIMNAQKVRQLVQQLFSFRIDTTVLSQQARRRP